MKPHAFIAMPFGTKPGPDGRTPVQFDVVLARLLAPALRRAGYEVQRADEEARAGDIRVDMFQALLMADLVLVDVTLPNANVWYELGVRHALRARGVVLVYGALPGVESPKVFDVYTDRKRRYHLNAEGVPDPARLAGDLDALAEMVEETRNSSSRRIVSPVYALLPHLEQPKWKALLMAGQNEVSDAYNDWLARLEVARRSQYGGDVMTLAEETPNRGLALEGRRAAGESLLKLRQPALAIEQFDLALEIDPNDRATRRNRAVCLGRLQRHEEARAVVEALISEAGDEAEHWALYGRVEKDQWLARWREPARPNAAERLAAAQAEDALLAETIAPYRTGFIADPRHHYSGMNALTLMTLRRHLGGAVSQDEIEELQGGVRWAVASHLARAPKDYWARASRAELSVLCADSVATVQRDWRAAVAAADKDWFALDASRQTLVLLQELGFRPAETAAALAILDQEIARSTPPFMPRQVLLFSGHMMDQPSREVPRFPAAMAPAAAARLAEALALFDAGPQDLALCQAAAGGDLLFLEACAARQVRCQVMLPVDEPEFLQRSVLPSIEGERWRQRWQALKPHLAKPPRIMAAHLGPAPRDANAYERCNRWLLNTALAYGPDKLRFICLWNGGGGDGPGGTQHMKAEAERRTGQVVWIDTRTL